MSPAIPEAVVKSVKFNISIITVLQKYGIQYRKSGKAYKAYCPFHEHNGKTEKDPSMSINPVRNVFHCFGCGKDGDVIELVMQLDNCTFQQAIEKLLAINPTLAQQRRVAPVSNVKELSSTKQKDEERITVKEKTEAETEQVQNNPAVAEEERQNILHASIEQTTTAFCNSKEARQYLEKRGLDPLLLSQTYTIGFWPSEFHKNLVPEEKVKLSKLGLATNGSALFDNCIIFPLRKEGRITTIYGRNINVPSSAPIGRHYLMPGKREGLYLPTIGLNPRKPVIITESIIDSLSLFTAGYINVLPLLGVNGFLPDHMEYLKAQSFPNIFIALNGDDAGNRAAAQLKQNLQLQEIASEIIQLPNDKDINDMLLEMGPGKLKEWFHERTGEHTQAQQEKPTVWEDGEDLWILLGTHEYRVRKLSPVGMDRLKVTLRVRDVKDRFTFHDDTLDLYQARAREHFTNAIAKLFGIQSEAVKAEINRLSITLEELRLQLQHKEEKAKVYVMCKEEELAAMEQLKDPQLLEKMAADFEACGMIGNRNNCLLAFFVALSRLLEKALGILAVSRSSAGKSFFLELVAKFTPEECVETITKLTGSNLFYKSKDGIKRKLLVMEEDEGMKNAMFAIRILLSSDRLHLQGIRHDPQTGEMRDYVNVVEGPASVFIATTNQAAFDFETLNRFFPLYMDESREQTQKILEHLDRMDSAEGLEMKHRAKQIIKLYQNMQRLLKPLLVLNPIGTKVKYPPEILHSRREKTKLQILLKSVALFRQYQKEIKEKHLGDTVLQYIEVDQVDIDTVMWIAGDMLKESLCDLSKLCRDLLGHIHTIVDEKYAIEVRENENVERWNIIFTRKELSDRNHWSLWHVKEHLKELEENGYITQRIGKKGQRYSYSLADEAMPEVPDFE